MLSSQLTDRIILLLSPYNPARIGLFGSYAREDQGPDSDLDLLIQFKEQTGLIQLVQIQQELEDQLGVEVDLVTENSLKNPRLKIDILQDLITIFDEEG